LKKTLRSIGLIAIIAVILMTLTACGNKLVATKTTEEGGITLKETWEISFKNNEVSEIKSTFEFDDEEMASAYYQVLKLLPEESKVTQDKNKVSFIISADGFEDFGKAIKGQTKDNVKKQLESEGYTVK